MDETPEPRRNHQAEFARRIQYGLLAIAGASVTCGFLRAFFPGLKIDDTTAMFLGIAGLALIINQVTEFSGFGVVLKKTVEQLKEDVRSVETEVKSVGTAVGNLEKDVGPGSRSAVPIPSAEQVTAQVTETRVAANPNDPNKGRFGGKPEANGRRLIATIEPAAGLGSSQCRVHFRVVSTDPERPLTGKVTFHLHPTFGRWATYDVDVLGGMAEDDVISYGAFTLGAVADEGATRLELDLMQVPGGTKRFYEN